MRTVALVAPMNLVAVVAAMLVALLSSSVVAAQEIQFVGPLGGCRWRPYCRENAGGPATIEWSDWFAGGAGVIRRARGERGAGTFGVGVEGTAGVLSFPSTAPGRGTLSGGDRFQLRAGLWASAVTDGTGMRGEGGVLVLDTVDRKSTWLAPGVRLGAGWGNDGLGTTPHVVAALTLGPRPARDRFRPSNVQSEREAGLSFVSGFRAVAAMRAALAGDAAYQLTFGIELEPTFLLPPYSAHKFLGGDPHE